ncbi:MAG: hypothetical protein WA751_00055 [Candidatus Dormiibacterota bacterium]
MTRTPRIAALGLLLGGALVLSLTAATFPLALSQKQAVQVVLQDSRTDTQASSNYDIGKQNSVEQGIEARQDDANFSLLSQEGAASLSSGSAAPKAKDVSVYLTGSTKTPAEFLATINEPATTGANPVPAYTWYGVYRKNSQKEPWRLQYGQAILASLPAPGVTVTAGRAQIQSHGSDSAVAALVRYLNTGQGNISPTTDATSWYSSDQQETSAYAGSGIAVGFKFSTDPSPVTSVAVSGGTLEFGGIDEVTTQKAGSGEQCVEANSNNSAEYLTLVPAGIQYQEITVATLSQVAIFVPTGGGQPLQLLSLDSQVMTADTPACG